MIEYRVFFNKKPADLATLDKIDTVVVTQDLDTATEAQLTIPICADETGTWKKEPPTPEEPYEELRVEIRADDETWVPLIDGVVIGSNVTVSGDPGKSSFILVAQDDSYFLNRNATVLRICMRDPSPGNILKYCFEKFATRRTLDYNIKDVPDPNIEEDFTHRGKIMSMLQEMAKRHKRLLYLQPSESVGSNIVNLVPAPTDADKAKTSQTLVVMGKDRNVEQFELKENRDSPRFIASSSLSLTNKSTQILTSRLAVPDVPDIEPKAVEPAGKEHVTTLNDPKLAQEAEAWIKSYTHEATGMLVGGCFKGVLRPGDFVKVEAGDQGASANYLVRSVVHTLNRFAYIQEFHLKRQRLKAAPEPNALGGIV